MPTTKNPGSNRENENTRRMGGPASSSTSGNDSRSKDNTRSNQNRQQNSQNSKSHR